MRGTKQGIPKLPKTIFPIIGLICFLASLALSWTMFSMIHGYAGDAITNAEILMPVLIIVPTIVLVGFYFYLHEQAFGYANLYLDMRKVYIKHLNGLMALMPVKVPVGWVNSAPTNSRDGFVQLAPVTEATSKQDIARMASWIPEMIRHYTEQVTDRTNQLGARFTNVDYLQFDDWEAMLKQLDALTVDHLIPLARHVRNAAQVMLSDERRLEPDRSCGLSHVAQMEHLSADLCALNARFADLDGEGLIPEDLVPVTDRQHRLGHFLHMLLKVLPRYLEEQRERMADQAMQALVADINTLWHAYPKRDVSDAKSVAQARRYIRSERLAITEDFIELLTSHPGGEKALGWLDHFEPEMLRETVADMLNRGKLIDGEGKPIHPHAWKLIAFAGVEVRGANKNEEEDLPRDPTDAP
jgi:hypothetical protein